MLLVVLVLLVAIFILVEGDAEEDMVGWLGGM
jgi:hypothetical protein